MGVTHIIRLTNSENKCKFEFRIGSNLPPLVKVAPKWMDIFKLKYFTCYHIQVLFKASEIKMCVHSFKMWCFPPTQGRFAKLVVKSIWRVTTDSNNIIYFTTALWVRVYWGINFHEIDQKNILSLISQRCVPCILGHGAGHNLSTLPALSAGCCDPGRTAYRAEKNQFAETKVLQPL